MISTLFKTFNKSHTVSTLSSGIRFLSVHKNFATKQDLEEENAALKIGISLFDNSSMKYEPTKKEEILKKSIQKGHRESNSNILSRPQKIPGIKKSRLERKNDSKFIQDQELGIEFLKLSINDPRLSTLLTSVRSKKRRDKDHQIIIEGRRLILEALQSGLKLNCVVFSRKEPLSEIKEQISLAQKIFKTKIYKVPHHDLKTWSTLSTPPGVMAIFERPSLRSVVSKLNTGSTASLPITVVCDNIREPNNLGSIIRTCAALPCLQIVITRGCCDPWESKVLRGGCGGHFRLPIYDNVDWEKVPLMIPPEVVNNCFIFVAENNLEKLQSKSSPIVKEYTEVENTGSHNVVVIGGESHGVSEDAYRFMQTVGSKGRCLNIPLAQGIDSLNVASALTLILYELRKNILKSKQDKQQEV